MPKAGRRVGNAKLIRNAILEALRDHPFLSRRQLELYVRSSGRTVRRRLRELKTSKWVWRMNARQPWMHTRSLFALTQAGIEELARQSVLLPADYRSQAQLSANRLGRIVLELERVFQLRTFFLWLSEPKNRQMERKDDASRRASRRATKTIQAEVQKTKPGAPAWHAVTWDIEIGKLFSAKGKATWIPFHGAALMQRGDGRWALVVVEFDLRRVPVERDRERLSQFVAAQDDPRYWGKDKDQSFPVLLVIAQDELRLQDYYNVLRSAALTRQLPMPRAYLTSFGAMLSLREDRTRPIWHSTISGRPTALLFDTQGAPSPLPDRIPWRKMPLNAAKDAGVDAQITGVIASESSAARVSTPGDPESTQSVEGIDVLMQIALNLGPVEKRLLDEIAAHPLLTRDELILLLQVSLRHVQPALAKMTMLKLVRTNRSRYLLAPRGLHYLALVAGFGNAVHRYARARGWGEGFDALVRHWEHTKQENKFFLHLAAVAQDWHHTLSWFSELEGRLYYEAGERRHSFLPDGRGSYIAGQERYEFALEIDRSRSPQERIRRKLAEYEACISSNVLRSEGIELLRMLVVTNSWERAGTWQRTADSAHVRFPILITTFDRLYASGADAPIWLRGDAPDSGESAATSPKVYCFECFARGQKPQSVLKRSA